MGRDKDRKRKRDRGLISVRVAITHKLPDKELNERHIDANALVIPFEIGYIMSLFSLSLCPLEQP